MGAANVVRTIAMGSIGLATAAAIAMAAAGAASATPGVVDTQSGGTVDVDGTHGTWVPAVSGDQRQPSAQSTGSHDIVSDSCYVVSKGCPPPASFDPRTISSTAGSSDDADSALDADGYQADDVRGPAVAAMPPSAANLPRGYYHN